MKGLLVIITCLLGASVPADAAPTRAELVERADALTERLAGQGYTIVIEAPFVVIGDERPARVRQRVKFLRWVVKLIEKDFFANQPDKLIEVWLFRDVDTYTAGAKQLFGHDPTTPYGYYSPDDSALIMNIGPGAGTLSHELVHPYFEANFPDAPSWFNEGLASLYEQPRARDGHLWGTTNWRLPGLQKMIRAKKLPSLRTLLRTSRTGFYDASYDAYAYARFVCQYLQDHGKLRAFYARFAADTKDPTGEAALVEVLGQDLASFEPVFRRWALSLRR